MAAALNASMRRIKPSKMILALGAITAVPVVLVATDNDDIDRRRNPDFKTAKRELWVEDAQGFFQTMASWFYDLGSSSSSNKNSTDVTGKYQYCTINFESSTFTTLSPRRPPPSLKPGPHQTSSPVTMTTTTAPPPQTQTPPTTQTQLTINLTEEEEEQIQTAIVHHIDYDLLGTDPPTTHLAHQFSSLLHLVRRNAEHIYGQPLPSSRFSDAELMRYAVHHGFLRARDRAAAMRALHHAAVAAAETADWLTRYNFASDEEFERFSELIWWTQASGPHAGRPTLHVDIGRAVHQCRGKAAIEFANTVVSQVERAVRTKLRDAPEGYDRVDVVMYAQGISAMSASRAAVVMSSVVSTLSHHFPGRLHELAILDLPRMLTWLVRGAKRLVHKATARKVVSVTSQTDGTAKHHSDPAAKE